MRTRLGTMPQLRQERSKSGGQGAAPSHATACRERAWAQQYQMLKCSDKDALTNEMKLRLGHWKKGCPRRTPWSNMRAEHTEAG